MRLFALGLTLLLIPSGAQAHHRHRITDGEREVAPSHCVYDPMFMSWNCWYKPVPRRRRHHHHHHHYWDGSGHVPSFTPNKHNEHGVPCYFYKKGPWCF
jgi:hypothetical protein